jgi:hypothetical protein
VRLSHFQEGEVGRLAEVDVTELTACKSSKQEGSALIPPVVLSFDFAENMVAEDVVDADCREAVVVVARSKHEQVSPDLCIDDERASGVSQRLSADGCRPVHGAGANTEESG